MGELQEDSLALLRSKLLPPARRSSLVRREPLLARLDDGLDRKLTLLSAPAGFGKTTLLAEWLATRREGQDRPPVGWVSLDQGDNDPVRFWRYAIAACQAFAPTLGISALTLLERPGIALQAMLTALINESLQLAYGGVLVLDDCQTINAQPVHESLVFLVDHLPPVLHLIVITRTDPPLPLARLRARGELNELRAPDLRFTTPDTMAFFQTALPFPLAEEIVSRVAGRTEGWPAGLRLLALALQGRGDQAEIESFLATFAGSHRPIVDYLITEVFGTQPEEVRSFLLQTSTLKRLSASLCNAVAGREDGADMLQHLERANLFLVPLDATGQWYRYHGLFAEAVQHLARERLGEAEMLRLSANASRWYEQHSMLGEAVDAALAGGQTTRAGELIEAIVAPSLAQNEYQTLRRWLEQLPEAVLRAHPNLAMTYATAILFTLSRRSPATFALLEPPLAIAEQSWKAQDDRPRLGELLSFRALVAWLKDDMGEAFALARESLTLLADGERQWRGSSLLFVGAESLLAGRPVDAQRTLSEARSLSEAAGNFYATILCTCLLADVCAERGQLRQAAELYAEALEAASGAPGESDPPLVRSRASALAGLARLSLERNDLELAREQASVALEIGERFPDEDFLARAAVVLAFVQQARGEDHRAHETLDRLIARTRRPLVVRDAQAHQAWLAIMSGDLAGAARWQATLVPDSGSGTLILREREAFISTRVLIAQGRPEAALAMLEPWLSDARSNGRTRSELELLVLRARAQWLRQERGEAVQTLCQALELAQPEDYRRLFLNEGQVMMALLQAALPAVKDRPSGMFVRTLLRDPGAEGSATRSVSNADQSPLVEPLSAQERRVLRLLVAGLSNPEIARELVVSINTVKSQAKSIYRKLDVNSREEAAEVARYLELL